MKGSSFEKIGFVLSLMVLALLHGGAARWHGWFPNGVLDRAQWEVEKMLHAPSLASHGVRIDARRPSSRN